MARFRHESMNPSPTELGYDPSQFEDQTPRSVALSNESNQAAGGRSDFIEQVRSGNQFGYLFKSTTGHQSSDGYFRGGVKGTIDTRAVGHDVGGGYVLRTAGECSSTSVRASSESRDLIDRAAVRDSRGQIIGLNLSLKADPARGDWQLSNSDGSTTWHTAVELAADRSSDEHKLTDERSARLRSELGPWGVLDD